MVESIASQIPGCKAIMVQSDKSSIWTLILLMTICVNMFAIILFSYRINLW